MPVRGCAAGGVGVGGGGVGGGGGGERRPGEAVRRVGLLLIHHLTARVDAAAESFLGTTPQNCSMEAECL